MGAVAAHQRGGIDPALGRQQRQLLEEDLDAADDGRGLEGQVAGEPVDAGLELGPGAGQVEPGGAGHLGRPPRPGLGPGPADEGRDPQEGRRELDGDDRVAPLRRSALEGLGDHPEDLLPQRLARRAGDEIADLTHEVDPEGHPAEEHVEDGVLRAFRRCHHRLGDRPHGVEGGPGAELAGRRPHAPAQRPGPRGPDPPPRRRHA